MIDINEHDFHKLDLNLLLVFTALLRERSVTRAAKRLYLGQPAMSASLARLRAFAGDDLFVRTARGMEPTAHALALAERLKPALEGLSTALFTDTAFDPASSDRTFALGMFDIGEVTLAPALLGALAAQAPRIRLALRPVDQANAVAQLEAGTLELAITDIGPTTGWICTKPLFKESFACMFDPKLVQVRIPISLQDYLAYPHLLTSFGGEFTGYVDDVLVERGLSRHVTMTTTRFSTLPFVLRRFRGIASLPGTAARELGSALGLEVSPLPFEVPAVGLHLVWHARHETDKGHQWLRDLVYRSCMRLAPPRRNRKVSASHPKARCD
ncbi:LysR family transcriptional regulator [Telluria aromaticivorans]|uniref:LysR family transcriptional regulator n=1 Tax=Telluria aromaticivorans TaxID=2725995 RepID=A0A7Y2K1F3_9BURK|nr:LysR family transcriptional regulator [Telluria aromaticivorans]NNG24593.1 LysR family transcriptional regulator [Telluria aromaticivorans]